MVVIAMSLAGWTMRAGLAGFSRALALVGLVAINANAVAAQSASSRAPATAALAKGAPLPPAPDSLVISVITMGPGPEIFERFGHISIRVHDLRTGIDTSYNWGMFDFEQPHFLQRFLTGDTRYWMQGWPTGPLVAAYRQAHRWVTEQELALTPVQADSLRRYIQWFAREENKWYRYDYYRDNCSTRVRDAIDMVLGGDFQRAVAVRNHGVSYRGETLRLGVAFPVLNLGMDFALGRPADATLSAWEEMFVPMRLLELLRDAKVSNADGTTRPLVRAERRLVVDERFAEQNSPPDLNWSSLAVGLGLAVVLLALSVFAGRSAAARGGIATIGAAWHLVAGLAGLLVLCLGLFTRHVYMARNANMLLATPASLALALLLPLAIVRPTARRIRAARALAVLAAACALTAVVLRMVPALAQENTPLLALAVPVQLALALALWRATATRQGGTA
jgi:uncharacterized protein DUF4105